MISVSAEQDVAEAAKPSLGMWLLPVALGAGAALFMLWIVARGVGVTADSTVYVTAARSLLAGEGLASGGNPLTIFAPGYSLALAGAALCCGGDVLRGARFLHAALFGVNVALAVAAVLAATRRSTGAAACVICLYLASWPLLAAHALAWSEPLFLAFTLAAALLLARYPAQPRRELLLGGALAAGLAMATRYAGVALLPAGLLCLLLFGGRSARRRAWDGVVFTVVACLPLGAALARNAAVAGAATGHSAAGQPIGWADVQEMVAALYAFVFPVEAVWGVKAAQLGLFVVLLGAGFALLLRRGGGRARSAPLAVTYPAFALAFAASHLALALASVAWLDANIALDERILLPVFALLAPAAVIVARALAQETGQPIIWWAFVALAFLAVTFNLGAAAPRVVAFRRDGVGYTARVWQDSATVAAIRRLPESVELYSEGWDAIRFLADRRAATIPWATLPGSGAPNPEYRQQVGALCARVAEGNAALVYFDQVAQRAHLPAPEEVVAACGAPLLADLADGEIYGRAGLLPGAAPR